MIYIHNGLQGFYHFFIDDSAPSCSLKYHTTCDISRAGTCPTMISPSFAWPDSSLCRGIIICSIQAIMLLSDLRSNHVKLDITYSHMARCTDIIACTASDNAHA